MTSHLIKAAFAAALCMVALSACSPANKEASAPAQAPGAAQIQAAATQGPLDAAAQKQIDALIGAYLIAHPEAVEQALATLEARRQQDRFDQVASDTRNFSIGPADAKVHIVEFFDYRCVHCKEALAWSMDKIKNRKDVRFTFVEFPILTPNSLEASRAAIASIKQGRYLDFHQRMMNSKGELAAKEIDFYAQQAGIDVARMRRDMEDGAIMGLLQKNHDVAAAAKVDGTPGFAINGKFFYGYDPDTLDKGLREALAGKTPA